MHTAPDFLFIDAILLAYRLGQVRHEEQKHALIAAARASKDSIEFMTALENFGVGRRSQLHAFVSKVLAAPAYYRAQYPLILGLHREDEAAESFLQNQYVLFLVEPVLTSKQQALFHDAYWWFSNQHQSLCIDPKRGQHIGTYATEPQDNASTLSRFEDYLLRLQSHTNQHVREQYETFPTDIVIAILQRAFV